MRTHRVLLAWSFALAIGQEPAIADNFVVTTAQVPLCTGNQNAAWERAAANQEGVEARDPQGHWVSNYPVYERDSLTFDDLIYRPFSVVKRTYCGTLGSYSFYNPFH